MFTEYEIETMIQHPKILEATQKLKNDFTQNEAEFLEISEHDFFSLIMMAPTVGLALANGTIGLMEELALNKKARKLSRGGYFLKKDPVVYGMKFLIKAFDAWEERFYSVIKLSMKETLDFNRLKVGAISPGEVTQDQFRKEVMNTPYLFIRFMASFFLENDEDIINERNIREIEYQKLMEIGRKLDLSNIPVFYMFCATFIRR